MEYQNWLQLFDNQKLIQLLLSTQKEEFLKTISDVSLASDAFFPFRDNIDNASKIGVKYIIQPGGSIADEEVIKACDKYGMAMVMTGSKMRMFLH